jgi:hypothetical protein
MWNSADEYLPSTTPPFAKSLESTCTMLQNIRSRTNTSVITSLTPIQSTSYENANSIYLANLPTSIQLASLASFSPPGLATLDILVDSTTHYETHTSRHFSIFSQIFQTTAPLIHGGPLRIEQWKTLGTEWIKHQQALTIYQYGPHPLLGDGILDHQFLWYLQDIHHRFSMNGGHV